jgi:hypothetical protein
MSVVVANATGDASTAIWDTVTNTPSMHATTNISVSTTSVFSATFTAPNTTNACKGVLVCFAVLPTSLRNYTAVLQQATVDTAATVTVSNINTLTGTAPYWVYFKFATPFVFTTTVAGSYRFKFTGSGTAVTGALVADSGGLNFSYIAVDDRVASAANNELYILPPNMGTGYTVTYSGSTTISNNVDVSTTITPRSVGFAALIGPGCVLQADTTASTTLTSKGHIVPCGGGEFRVGTSASPLSSAFTATINMSQAVSSQATIKPWDAKLTLQGASKTYTKTTYVSGNGTTGTPLIVGDTTGWAVNDELVIGTTRLNSDNEYKFIKTISATSITLSDTAGGVESGLVNTHDAGAIIANLQRNIVVNGVSSAITTGLTITNVTTAGYVDMDWMRWATGIATLSIVNGVGVIAGMDNCVITQMNNGVVVSTSKVTQTFSNNIIANPLNQASATQLGSFRVTANANNKTLSDILVFGNSVASSRVGFTIGSYNVTLNRCMTFGGNVDRRSVFEGPFALSAAGSVTLNDCKAIGNKYVSVALGGATDITFNRFTSTSTETTPPDDVYAATDTYQTVLFNNSTFIGTSLVNNYANAIPGTLIRFNRYQNTDNTHIWYTVDGKAQSTGAALADTTVRTSGSLGVRLAPETVSGLYHSYKVIAKPSNYVGVSGFVQMNAAFAGATNTSLVIELYLPGSTTADATTTITKTASTWQAYSLGAVYSGTTYGYATVNVKAVNTDAIAAAYVYHDDILNGTNPITALDVWDAGQPSPIMFEQLGDAAAVWGVLTSGLTTTGTTGKVLADEVLAQNLIKDGLS